MWRTTFELLNLMKLLGFKGPTAHYFAFGANLDPEVMKRRAMKILAAEPATAQGYALKFNHEVPFRGVGMASMEVVAGESIRGIIYTVSKVDEWIMDCYESTTFLHRYEKLLLTVSGKPCFGYRTRRPLNGLLPSKAYLAKIITGYRANFPEERQFIKKLEAMNSVPDMVTAYPPRFLFTDYEKFGKALRPLLERYDAVCVKVFVKLIFRPSVFHRWLTV